MQHVLSFVCSNGPRTCTCTEEEVEAIFEEADTDKNGSIEQEEFTDSIAGLWLLEQGS